MSASSILPNSFICHIDSYQITIQQYLGQYSHGIDYYRVEFQDLKSDSNNSQKGLLRAGSPESGLARELELRKTLGQSQMLIDVIANCITTLEISNSSHSKSLQRETDHFVQEEILQIHSDQEETQSRPTEPEVVFSKTLQPDTLPSKLEVSNDIIQQDSPFAITARNDLDQKLKSADELVELHKQDENKKENFEAGIVNQEKQDMLEEEADDESALFSDDNHLITNSNFNQDCPNDAATDENIDEYLEEEVFPEQHIGENPLYESEVLLLLSQNPEESETLEEWICKKPNTLDSISTLIQICQFCLVLSQREWCLTHINPEFVYLGKPIRILDLPDVHPIGSTLQNALEGDYCSPELSYGNIDCQDSIMTYLVGALLYRCLYHQKLPSRQGEDSLNLLPHPLLHQILTISLSPYPEERFPVAQLRDLLVSTRHTLNKKSYFWKVASQTTVGLSNNRLQNEDSYGIRQSLINQKQLSIFAVADGMGGMAQGEVASRLAIETVLNTSLPAKLNYEDIDQWFKSVFEQANREINDSIKNGGTTLSVAMCMDSNLWIGHVGDSRIYHVQNHQLQQISEDHSMVAMLVASGEITAEEAIDHPDSNVLLKALGSTSHLSDGYIQVSSHSQLVEESDLLLLCSDGVWGVLNDQLLLNLMQKHHESLDQKADEIMSHVLNAGAPDNATVIIAQVYFSTPSHIF